MILPVLLSVVFGILEYGWIFYQQFNLASAVRNGCARGSPSRRRPRPIRESPVEQKALADLQTMGDHARPVSPSPRPTPERADADHDPVRIDDLQQADRLRPHAGAALAYAMTMMLELQ